MSLAEAIRTQEEALAVYEQLIPGTLPAADEWERAVTAARLVLGAAKKQLSNES